MKHFFGTIVALLVGLLSVQPLRASLPHEWDFSRQDAMPQRVASHEDGAVSHSLAHFRTLELTNFPSILGPDIEGPWTVFEAVEGSYRDKRTNRLASGGLIL